MSIQGGSTLALGEKGKCCRAAAAQAHSFDKTLDLAIICVTIGGIDVAMFHTP